ncbi:MAG: alpha/beta hydrolase [Bacilli bacterium]
MWIIPLLVVLLLIIIYLSFSLMVVEIFYNRSLVRPKPNKKQSKIQKEMADELFNDERRKEFKIAYADILNSSEEVEILNDKGEKLKGRLLKRNDDPLWVICCHGWMSNKENDTAFSGKCFYDHGYNILMVDHYAHGQSEGKRIGFGINDAPNALKWIKYLNERMHNPQIILWGVSMGASTLMYLSANEELPSNVKCIIADCGFTSPYEEFSYLAKYRYHLPLFPTMMFMRMKTKKLNGYDMKTSTYDSLQKSKAPVLFICGDNDTFVPLKFTKKNYEMTNNEKELLVVKDAIHGSCYMTNKEEYYQAVKSFTEKYID